jgi:hypothetical protein
MCRPVADEPGRWLARWVVHNDGPAPVELDTAWIPHGRFRGDGRLPLSGEIAPKASGELKFLVTASEAPGTRVENAFLILRVNVQATAWRVFVRMRIEFDAEAVPTPVVESVTTQCLE